MILDHEALGLIIKREHPWIWLGEYRPWVPMEHHVGVGCPSVFRECFWRWRRGDVAGFMPRDGEW